MGLIASYCQKETYFTRNGVMQGLVVLLYFGCKLNKLNYILKQPKLGSWMSVTAASERGKTPRYEYLPSPNIKISFLALLRATISP